MAGGPLQGVRLVDLGRGEAARLAATLLCDLGADGVRIGPSGEPTACGAALERSRRTCPEPDAATLLRWLERCDVVVDDGELARRGLGIAVLRAANPGLVVLRCPQAAGDVEARPCGPVAGAAAGVYAPPLNRKPRWTPLPAAETLAGLTGATGAVAALVARQRDGRGQVVTAPLEDAAYVAVEMLLALSDRAPSVWVGARWASTPFIGPYRCADGRHVFVHLGLAHHVDRLLEVLRSDGLIRAAGALKRAMSAETRADPGEVGSPAEASAIKGQLAELFESRPAASWEALLGGGGLCCVMVRSGPEWRNHPQAREAGHVIELEDAILGRALQPGPWVRCGAEAPRPRAEGKPSWGARKSALSEPDERPPLAGLRVLDCTQVIAGPVAGRTLAELGAEVVRLERPHFDPSWAEAFHVVFNPGKRSVVLELDPDAARTILESLQPDVVLHNWRSGVDARLGLDPEQVRAVCPDAVVVRLNAYGETGPWSELPGWEQTAQAACGMQLDYGDGIPDLVPLPLNDESTGLAGALGALAALYERGRGRRPSPVHTSLAASATWLQRRWLFDPRGRAPRRERGASLGAGPLRRFVRARDGWLWLEGSADAVRQVPGLEGLDPEDADALDTAIRRRSVATWVTRSHGIAGLQIGRWHTLGQAVRAPVAPIHRPHQPGLGRVTRVDLGLHLDRTPVVRPDRAALRGIDGPELLGTTDLDLLPAEPLRPRDLPRRLRRRGRWAIEMARWGAYLASTRLLALLLVVLVACGGSEVEPVVADEVPFVALDDSDVALAESGGSAGGLGLSASATRVDELRLDRDGEGRLRLSWRADRALRLRSWDGSAWTDEVVPLKGEGRQRARPFEIGPGPDGAVTLGVQLPGVEHVPPADLRAVLGGTEQIWTGFVEGTWTHDPQGRLVWAFFAGPEVQVRRWDGGQWLALGDDSAPKGFRAGKRTGPAVAFTPEGEPVVAWREPYAVLPEKGGPDRFKSTRWRTRVLRWDGRDWDELSGRDTPLDEDPREKYPQPLPGADRNLRAEWEAAQENPPRLAVDAGGTVYVAWDTLEGLQVHAHDGKWSALPQPVDLPGDAEAPALAAGPEGLVLAWAHQWRGKRKRLPKQIQVRVWDGSAWTDPGEVGRAGVSRTLGPSVRPEVGWHDGAPVVAWVDLTSGAPEVLLSWFDGSAWVGLPDLPRASGLGSPDRMSSVPAVVVGETGPAVAWVEDLETTIPAGRSVVRTAVWDAAWRRYEDVELPARPFQLRLAHSGEKLYALWDQRAGNGPKGLFVSFLLDRGWKPVGPERGLVKDARGAYDADLAVDQTGQPWAAWTHSGRTPQVRRFDGSRWTVVGELPGESAPGFAPDLAFAEGGRPWVLWIAASANREVDLKLAWFDGTDWQKVGDSWWLGCDSNIGTAAPTEAALSVDPKGRPVVAWITRGVGGKAKDGPPGQPPSLNVCVWEGRSWLALPSPAEGRKIRAHDPRRSQLDLEAAHGIVVSWSEDRGEARQIQALRWDGGAWLPLGDREGAVSECDGACWSPTLGEGPAGRCVAWEAMAERGRSVSLRCQLAED